jgi:hypothetical protein
VSSLRPLGLDTWGAQSFLLALLSVVGIALGGWFLATGIVQVADTNALLAGGDRAIAQVVSVDESVPNPVGAPDDILYTTTVNFVATDGTLVDAVLPLAGVQPDLAVGDQVEVVYDRDAPASVFLDDDGIIASQSIAIWIGAVVILVAGVLGVLALRIFRKGRASIAA